MCIFTYGQTSSGKTHTMKGLESEPGVIPLSLQHLFEQLEAKQGIEYSVKINYVEIYNETINDLLKHGNTNLDIKLDIDKSLKIKGLTQQAVSSKKEALSFLYVFLTKL